MSDTPNAFPCGPERRRPDQDAEHGRGQPGLALAAKLAEDDGLLDMLADRLADRLAERLSPVELPEALVDAREVARRTGKTRRWVYEHARELGGVPLGTGPRPRLGFSPDVIAHLKAAPRRPASTPPLRVKPRRRHGSSSGASRTVAELLDGQRPVIGSRARTGGQR